MRALIRTSLALALASAIVSTSTALLASAATQKFFNDDPLWVEPALQDASRVAPTEVNLFVDLVYNILTGKPVVDAGHAKNVNTIDEVPDSSWFTNRAGRRPLTPADVEVGPNTSSGPAPGTWTITSSKSDGVTPGFTVKDNQGQKWFLKFDAPGYRGMTTGTEVAVTKLMWALGYNVPENHIAYMRVEDLAVGPNAKFTPPGGTARKMLAKDLDTLLAKANRETDGSYRVVASKALAGKPVGRIRFAGTRPDDPNDIVPHEDRRELRGYGVFAAWLNHVDAKAINSLDTLVVEEGQSYVRHHLIDFGSALGSGGVGPADYWAGYEYLVQPRGMAKQMAGFGFSSPKWHTAAFYESRSIGRLASDPADFQPELWKPRVPNQAFLHARADDQFWAAKKLMAVSTDMLRAAVRAGQFGDPDAEEFLVNALARRRDVIGRTYLTAINPISEPVLEGGTLSFVNAAVENDLAKAPESYRAAWSIFDNATGTTKGFGETSSRSTTVDAPAALPRTDGVFVKVSLSAIGGSSPSWSVPVDAYFRLLNGSWRLIGFERMAEAK